MRDVGFYAGWGAGRAPPGNQPHSSVRETGWSWLAPPARRRLVCAPESAGVRELRSQQVCSAALCSGMERAPMPGSVLEGPGWRLGPPPTRVFPSLRLGGTWHRCQPQQVRLIETPESSAVSIGRLVTHLQTPPRMSPHRSRIKNIESSCDLSAEEEGFNPEAKFILSVTCLLI